MGSDKVEKRLPDDILALIDQEASSKGMSRQEIISLLIAAVKEANLTEENKELKRDIEYLHKQQKENVSEIQFLRDEIGKFSSGLTSLAVTLGEGKASNAQSPATDPLSAQIQELSDEIAHLKEATSGETQTVIEKNLSLIIVSVLAGLLLVYLIISKVM